jgi:hypothetical protein
MSVAPCIKHLRHVVCAATLALAVAGGAGHAWAQAAAEEEDDIENHILNADKRLFNSLMGSLGLASTAPTITYRERPPLVVPQSRDLPPPGKAVKGPDWPVDPEIKQRKKEASAVPIGPGRKGQQPDDSRPISGTAENWKTGDTGTWAEEKKGPKEPEFLKMLMSGSLSGTWEEYGKFEGEPPRTSLVQPPSGYLTPSPAAPYGMTPRASEPPKKEPKL